MWIQVESSRKGSRNEVQCPAELGTAPGLLAPSAFFQSPCSGCRKAAWKLAEPYSGRPPIVFRKTVFALHVFLKLFRSLEAPAPAPAVVFASSPLGASFPGPRGDPGDVGPVGDAGPDGLQGRRVRQVPPSWFHCLWELQTLGCQCIPCRCL